MLARSLICIAGETGRSRSVSLGIRGLLGHLPRLTLVSIRIAAPLLRRLLGSLAGLPLIPIRIPVSLLGRLILGLPLFGQEHLGSRAPDFAGSPEGAFPDIDFVADTADTRLNPAWMITSFLFKNWRRMHTASVILLAISVFVFEIYLYKYQKGTLPQKEGCGPVPLIP